MNKHILLVMQWLNNKDSVTIGELEENRGGAYAAYTAAAYEVYNAATGANFDDAASAAYWLDEYFKETGEDRSEYEKELNK